MVPDEPRIRWDTLDTTTVATGITAALVMGEQLSAARYVLDPGAVVPEHSHDSEEFGHVIGGGLDLRCGDATVTLAAGEAFVVPAGVVHAGRALADGCELLECYAPPRRPLPAPPKDPT